MFTALYLLFMLPVLAGLFYLLAVVRVWRSNWTLALAMLLFWPAGLYALVHYWKDETEKVRVPLLASIGACVLWGCLLLWGAHQAPSYPEGYVESSDAQEDAPVNDHGSDLTDKLHFSVALAKLPYRNGRVELAPAHAAIEVPTHFRFVDRENLDALYAESDNGPGVTTLGWLVHESVNLADDDAWYIDIAWLGDGYVAENDLATRAHDALLADAQRETEKLSAQQGGAGGFSLAGYAEQPVLDANMHSVTWVEDLAYTGQAEHKLDCYAAKLGRGGALLYSINDTVPKRQELCLRSVRLASARTEFDAGQTYADHSGLLDHKAKYDLGALVTGAFTSKR